MALAIGVNLTYKLYLANFPGLTLTPNPEGNFAEASKFSRSPNPNLGEGITG
ncbi:MAG: hypothetical protein V7L20_12105 [Nostoc sp.]|uniref:hypothetical protein n=1 Tax=Nostoc sp. TaxID=1180 RepID=UPI002FF46926